MVWDMHDALRFSPRFNVCPFFWQLATNETPDGNMYICAERD
jgi:hypothetical protein